MQYRALGNSGLKVSVVSFGTWLTFGGRLDERSSSALVKTALDLGINFFDTADVYEQGEAESVLGELLSGVPRKDVVLASKCYFPTGDGPNDRGLSRKHIDESVYASLQRLGTEYLDLYQCHRYDEETPLEETVRAMGDLIRQGKVLYWGVSMWTAEQIEDAVRIAHDLGVPAPISNQPCYNLLDRSIEASVVPACQECGLGTIPFSPLAQGVLSGKYRGGARPDGSRLADERRNKFMGRYLEDDAAARVDAFAGLAAEAGLAPAQLALAWVLAQPTIASVIVGATRTAQLEENATAAGAELDDALLARLDELFPADATD